MSRAVVVDAPDRAITISLYGENGSAASVALSPQRALHLAGELLAAAARRLG